MLPIFDSRNKEYKRPFGAVRENTEVHFKIILPRSIKCSEASLSIISDTTKKEDICAMFWCGMKGEDYEAWECDYAPSFSDIYWYSFNVKTDDGYKKIYKERYSSVGVITDHMQESWQLTVYSKDFSPPKWLVGGVMYQIFPDRFFYSGIKKDNVPSDRIISKDWYKTPNWRPDILGEVKNNEYYLGDLAGICKKLDYLKELGVTCIYLNPIFEAHSSHRYNVADYTKIDTLLGTEEDLKNLCRCAKERGINIIIDGVFSHTGSDSRYFNKESRYKTLGAFNSKDSPFYSWYNFKEWPQDYDSWWGFKTLPETNETDTSFNEFINGKDGIAQRWLRQEVKGWRLDVSDELPDSFMENFRRAVKVRDKDALILGEVWEDASNKISYGNRRRFLLGKQLDSVMNYPFRSAILDFLKGENGKFIIERIESILENYPKEVVRILMNPISTHDTIRVITELSGENPQNMTKEQRSEFHLSKEKKELGIKLCKMASAMQYTLPGVPCIYYADEAGKEGYEDPFNRGTYPWDREESELINWYKNLGKLRSLGDAFFGESIDVLKVEEHFISFARRGENTQALCAFNVSNKVKSVAWNYTDKIFSIGDFDVFDGKIQVKPRSIAILLNGQTI